MKYTGFLAVVAILAVIFVSPALANGNKYEALTLEVPLVSQDAGQGKSALTGVLGFSIAMAGCDQVSAMRCGTMGFSFFNLELSQNRAREIWNKGADRQFGFHLAMFEPGFVLPLDGNQSLRFLSLSALVGQAISSRSASGDKSAWVGGAAYGVRFGLTAEISKPVVATVSMRVIGSPLRDFQDLFGTHFVVLSLGLGMQF